MAPLRRDEWLAAEGSVPVTAPCVRAVGVAAAPPGSARAGGGAEEVEGVAAVVQRVDDEGVPSVGGQEPEDTDGARDDAGYDGGPHETIEEPAADRRVTGADEQHDEHCVGAVREKPK